MTTQLERLLKKQKELLKEIEKAKAKELQKDKKYLDKKCQIVGSYFLNQYKDKMDELKRKIDPFVKGVKDRKLFGLEIKPKETHQPKPTIDSTDPTDPASKSPYWKKKW